MSLQEYRQFIASRAVTAQMQGAAQANLNLQEAEQHGADLFAAE